VDRSAHPSAIIVAGDGCTRRCGLRCGRPCGRRTPGLLVQTHEQAVEYLVGKLSGSATVPAAVLMAFVVIAGGSSPGSSIRQHVPGLVAQTDARTRTDALHGGKFGQVYRNDPHRGGDPGRRVGGPRCVARIGGAASMAALSRSGSYQVPARRTRPSTRRPASSGSLSACLLTVVAALTPARRGDPGSARRGPATGRRGSSTPGAGRSARMASRWSWSAVGRSRMVAGAHGAGLPLRALGGISLLPSACSCRSAGAHSGDRSPASGRPSRGLGADASRIAQCDPTSEADRGDRVRLVGPGVTLVTMMVVGETSVRES